MIILFGPFLQYFCTTSCESPGLQSRGVLVSLLISIITQSLGPCFLMILSFNHVCLIKLSFHNIMNQLHDGLIPKKKFMIKKILDNLQLFPQKSIKNNPSVPHKWGIPKSKGKYAHVKHGPMEHIPRSCVMLYYNYMY